MEERIQKIIASRGYCSRRQAEALIEKGVVFVNGEKATLGLKVDVDAKIVIDGKEVLAINSEDKKVYLALNKPLGVITTSSDDRNRKTITSLIDKKYGRVFPVGRLDINSSGLIFLTNDGDFANLVMHPSSSLGKTYAVTCKGSLTSLECKKLENGILLEDGYTSKAEVTLVKSTDEVSKIYITIHEGRNRQVRNMLKAINHDVISLKRVAIGNYKLKDSLKPGQYEEIDIKEVEKIKKLCRENKKNNNYDYNKERFRN